MGMKSSKQERNLMSCMSVLLHTVACNGLPVMKKVDPTGQGAVVRF
jgi:hypothetical protein